MACGRILRPFLYFLYDIVFLFKRQNVGMESSESTVVASLLATGFFVVFFAVGALLCIEKERLASKKLLPWIPGKKLFLVVGHRGPPLVQKSGTAVPV